MDVQPGGRSGSQNTAFSVNVTAIALSACTADPRLPNTGKIRRILLKIVGGSGVVKAREEETKCANLVASEK
jgi:hypothetical protein